VLAFDEIFKKIDETIAVGGNQLLLQGGHNPDLPIEWYEDLFRAVKAKYPRCSIKEVMEVSVMKDNKEVKDHYEVLIATAELKEVELTVTLDGKIE
jgi:2-iminoacetate synthase ThiH